MGLVLLQKKRVLIAISLVAAIFAVTAACGSETATPSTGGSDPIAAGTQSTADTTSPTSSGAAQVNPTRKSATESPSADSTAKVAEQSDPTPEPTEPPLINTPGPVANIAPDFTLPSIQGPEYTLTQFRGEKPVAIVFYRAYW